MGFELDEILFSKVVKYLKKRKENDPETLQRKINLDEIRPRLTLIARALCGQAIEIFPAEKEGGFKANNFFLPASCSLFSSKEENRQFYIFRTFFLSVQKHLGLNLKNLPNTDEEANLKAIETAPQVLNILFQNYPKLQDWFEEMYIQLPKDKKTQKPMVSWLYGKWMVEKPEDEVDKLKHIDKEKQKAFSKIKGATSLQAKAVEEIETLTIDQKQQEDYVLMHSFEKIETAEAFNGNWRDFDGKDELKDHKDALDEMNMKHTVRVDEQVHSVYQADFIEHTTIAESATIDDNGFHLKYDEWDYKKRCYLPDYCKVYPKAQIKALPSYYQNTLKKYQATLNGLRKMLTSVNNKLQVQKRQLQGETFDIDAVTDMYADIHAQRTPSERIYLSKRKKDKDIAILLLLDLSLSSDAYAAGNRVLDVEKEVSILFGEILNEFQINFSIDGFSSKTRNFTTYITLKDFQEDWQKAKHKIGAAEPNGYTRIGAALRHAGARLDTTDAKNKWVILLSDGKPNDYDRYEGQHGIQDIKQALRELNERNVNTYALAIEAQAKYYLPQMFGQNHYQILTSPVELLTALAKLYDKFKINKWKGL